MQLEQAKKAYKEAYEAGDSDKLVEAQTKLSEANYAVQRLKEYKPTLQQEEPEVEIPQNTQQAPQAPVIDAKTRAWQERNTWWGNDEEMTANALGLHQKLVKQYGAEYVGTDEYWRSVDETMHRRFPEYFGDDKFAGGGGKPTARAETKAATVVAPASRSTSSKKIVLKQSQVLIAKKLGLTPEQYAREMRKLEN
jgi:predicted transcriptional regulator